MVNISDINFKFLFPYKFKIIGLFLVVPGIILTIIRFYYGIKPTIFNVKVFAFYSKYLETKYFSIISNHISEEIAGILILVGLIFVVFSKEKIESDLIMKIRYESLIISILINSCLVILSYLFAFGLAFVGVLILNIYSFFIIYIIVFQLYIFKYRIKLNEQRNNQYGYNNKT